MKSLVGHLPTGGKEATLMTTRARLVGWLTEGMMVATSGGFLAWYVWVKVVAWPWGAYSY